MQLQFKLKFRILGNYMSGYKRMLTGFKNTSLHAPLSSIKYPLFAFPRNAYKGNIINTNNIIIPLSCKYTTNCLQ